MSRETLFLSDWAKISCQQQLSLAECELDRALQLSG
jgi:transposase